MLKFKTKKSDEVKTSPLTKKSNAVAKVTMFFATLIATMFCFAVTAYGCKQSFNLYFRSYPSSRTYYSCLGYCSGRLIVSNPRPITAL